MDHKGQRQQVTVGCFCSHRLQEAARAIWAAESSLKGLRLDTSRIELLVAAERLWKQGQRTGRRCPLTESCEREEVA